MAKRHSHLYNIFTKFARSFESDFSVTRLLLYYRTNTQKGESVLLVISCGDVFIDRWGYCQNLVWFMDQAELLLYISENVLFVYLWLSPSCWSYCSQVSANAKQDLKDGLALYNTDNNIGLRNAWNIIQAEVLIQTTQTILKNCITTYTTWPFFLSFSFMSQWKCCGVTGYTDWHEALKEKVVPDRCCQEHYQECGRNSTNMFWTRVSDSSRGCRHSSDFRVFLSVQPTILRFKCIFVSIQKSTLLLHSLKNISEWRRDQRKDWAH